MEILFSLNALFVVMLLACGTLTVYSYMKMRMLARYPEGEYYPYEYFLGTDFGTTLAASLTLLPIIFLLANSGPLGPAETKRKVVQETASYHYLGMRLGEEMAMSFLPPPKPTPPEGEGKPDLDAAPESTDEAAAESDGSTIPATVNVLLFYTVPSEAHQYYHDQLLAGFKAGMEKAGVTTVTITEHAIELKAPEGPTAGENTRATPEFTWPKLDSTVREAGEVDMIVSFMGLPFEFENSSTAQKVGQGKMKVGAISDSSFLLAPALQAGRVSAVIVPQINDFRPDDYDQTDVATDFSTRYVVLTPYNFDELSLQSPKLFQRRKVAR